MRARCFPSGLPPAGVAVGQPLCPSQPPVAAPSKPSPVRGSYISKIAIPPFFLYSYPQVVPRSGWRGRCAALATKGWEHKRFLSSKSGIPGGLGLWEGPPTPISLPALVQDSLGGSKPSLPFSSIFFILHKRSSVFGVPDTVLDLFRHDATQTGK